MSERINKSGKDSTNQKNYFNELKQKLKDEKGLDEESLKFLENDNIPFQINFYKIEAVDILNALEAALFNLGNLDKKNDLLDNLNLIQIIKTSLNEMINKKQKNERTNNNINTVRPIAQEESSNRPRLDITINNPVSNNNNILLVNHESNKRNIKFEITKTFDEANNGFSEKRNTSEIQLKFFPDKSIEEYTMVPINENVFVEEYKEYFRNVKNSFKENYIALTGQQSDTFEYDKFILLVLFENSDGKPSLSEIGFFDPLDNFKKYSIRDEDLSTLKDYYFFNGQIVMIEGELDNNNTIAIKDIRNGFVPDSYKLDYDHIMSFFKNGSPYCTYAMSGPYFAKNNMDLSDFIMALKKIALDKPHLVIFSGPFVSIENEIINKEKSIKLKENDHNCLTHHQIMENILSKINEIFNDLVTNVIICPSLLDTINIYPLPQPAFNTKYIKNYNNLDMVKKGRMKMICNPNIFNVNEMIVGVANFDFTKEMVNNHVKSPNKIPMEASLEMILNQKTFFPLLPSTLNSTEDEKCIILDYSKLNYLRINETPDIIITTSEMSTFFRKINSTLFVYLGNFYKGNTLGNIVKIMNFSPKVKSKHCEILNRLKIEIIKLVHEN